jgi:hypothetical protein
MEAPEIIRHKAEIAIPERKRLVVFIANSFNFSHPVIRKNVIPRVPAIL